MAYAAMRAEVCTPTNAEAVDFSERRWHRIGEISADNVVPLPSEEAAARALAANGTSNKFTAALVKILGGASNVRTQKVYDALSALGLTVASNKEKAEVSEALESLGYESTNEFGEDGKRARGWRRKDGVAA